MSETTENMTDAVLITDGEAEKAKPKSKRKKSGKMPRVIPYRKRSRRKRSAVGECMTDIDIEASDDRELGGGKEENEDCNEEENKYSKIEKEAENIVETEDPDIAIKNAYCVFRDYAIKQRRLTPDEEKDLARKIAAGDQDAYKKFIDSNLKLVIACTREVYRKNRKSGVLDFMDLIQEGVMGLITAVKKFDPEIGTRFSTYAVPWICQYITRVIDSQRDGLTIPGYAGFSLRSMNSEIKRYLEGTLDISQMSKTRLKRIKELASIMYPMIAIDNSVDPAEPSDTPYSISPDILQSNDLPSDDQEMIDNIEAARNKANFHQLLQEMLSPEEYILLCRRHGMGEYENEGAMPLRILAAEHGKSIEFTRLQIIEIEERLKSNQKAFSIMREWLLQKNALEKSEKTEKVSYYGQ